MKNARPLKEGPGVLLAERRADVCPNYTLNGRLMRLAVALLNNPQGLSREACDKVTPASNAPEYVRQLRNRLKLDIPCYRINHITRGGDASWYGVYSLTSEDRRKLREVLQ